MHACSVFSTTIVSPTEGFNRASEQYARSSGYNSWEIVVNPLNIPLSTVESFLTAMNRVLVADYLDRYEQTQGVLPERLEQFGTQYRDQGYITRDQLYEIAYESSTRSAYHVETNPSDRCRKVTANVVAVDGGFSKVQLVTGLNGFKAPTASCVLTALVLSRHAVVDTRVWASLERFDYLEGRKEAFDAADYVYN